MNLKNKFFLISLLLVCLSSCSNSEPAKQDNAYVQSKETILNREQNNPQDFLVVTSDDKKNLLGKTVVKGEIMNNASIVSYENVRIQLLSFQNKKMVEEHEDVISGVILPGKKNNFTLRYRLPKGTDSLHLKVMSAVVAKGKS
ncbi:MAG: hypothetical protein JSS67_02280 [Bacteroidetes bacterium]|nr:hypothetical protein [Bacteroidota bacterium]